MPLQRGIDLRALAEKTGQCSSAEVRGSICTETGMYSLREWRHHVTREDFEFSVAKVRSPACAPMGVFLNAGVLDVEEKPGREHICQQAVFMMYLLATTSSRTYVSFVSISLLPLITAVDKIRSAYRGSARRGYVQAHLF